MIVTVVDFKYVKFPNGKMNGGGFFSLKLVEYLMSLKKEVRIINNTTEYYKNISVVNMNEYRDKEFILEFYIDPLFTKLNSIIVDYDFKKLLFYVHGTRMLEIPYDITSYKYYKGIKRVSTFFKHIFFKKYYRFNSYRNILELENLENASILTPSTHSKYIIKSFSNINIKVVPPFLSSVVSDTEKKTLPCEKYILILNSERWVKNSYRFIKAFDELYKNSKMPDDLNLVVVGKPVFMNMFKNKIIYIDYVERSYLDYLIKNAFFLAFPTLNEGFGYPALDSFKYGVPVLCSSVSAPNIIYNGNVVFTNPFSEIEIKSRILYLIDLINNDKIDSVCLKKEYSRIKKKIDNSWNDVFGQL